jgi:hypothetical protein
MGITFDERTQKFVFDFEHDNEKDIVQLTDEGYQVEAFGKCFYYGYEFSEQVDSSVRSAFIQYVKFSEDLQKDSNLTQFIKKAIDDLSRKINLYDYQMVIMPESSVLCRKNQTVYDEEHAFFNHLDSIVITSVIAE